jgi:hypothetical protein
MYYCQARCCVAALTLMLLPLSSCPFTFRSLLDSHRTQTDSPPGGGGRPRCLCGHIFYMCRGTGSSERVNTNTHTHCSPIILERAPTLRFLLSIPIFLPFTSHTSHANLETFSLHKASPLDSSNEFSVVLRREPSRHSCLCVLLVYHGYDMTYPPLSLSNTGIQCCSIRS